MNSMPQCAARETRPGINYFKCDDCGREWIDTTRDVGSPSCESCTCGASVTPEEATTEQFDNFKHKLTPRGVLPINMRPDEVAKLVSEIEFLRSEFQEIQRDTLYCPHCACQSCYDEKQKRAEEDTW
jgi:hypothetical protein